MTPKTSKPTTSPSTTEREHERDRTIAMYLRCQLHTNHDLPLPFLPQMASEPIPPGFNQEGFIPEERGIMHDVILIEGVNGV